MGIAVQPVIPSFVALLALSAPAAAAYDGSVA